MFGIGGTELIVIGIVLLIAVGPKKLPNLLKAAIRGYREFQRATRDLRASTGIDEILRDEDLNALRKPLYVPPKQSKPAAKPAAAAPSFAGGHKPLLGYIERERELPPEGVDVAEAQDRLTRPSPDEAARIATEKQAIVDAKIAAAQADASDEDELDEDEKRRIIDAKNAAAGIDDPYDDPEHDRIVQAKIAAAREADGPPLDDPEHDRIVQAKIAAAQQADDGAIDDDTKRRIIDAKIAAAQQADDENEDDPLDDGPLDGPLDDEAKQRIVEAKIAAARTRDEASETQGEA